MDRRKINGNTTQRPELIFRQTWLCPVGSRHLGWLGQYLAVPIPGGKIWRWNFSADLHLLAVTFGYTMIMAETALGRMTRKSPVGAFAAFGKGRWRAFGGWINAVIPILIVPYYSVYWRLGYQVFGGVYYRSWQ